MPDVDEREARNPFSGPRADLGRRASNYRYNHYWRRRYRGPVLWAGSARADVYCGPVELCACSGRRRSQPPSHWQIASVLIAVALAFAILGILGTIIGRQAAQLTENLPAYQVVIGKKLDAVRSSAFGARMVEKAADALHGLENNIGKNAVAASPQPTQERTTQPVDHPLQVEVHEPPPGPVQILQSILSALLPSTRDCSDRDHFRGFHPCPSNDAICATDLSVSLARMICTVPRRPLMTPRSGSPGTSWP